MIKTNKDLTKDYYLKHPAELIHLEKENSDNFLYDFDSSYKVQLSNTISRDGLIAEYLFSDKDELAIYSTGSQKKNGVFSDTTNIKLSDGVLGNGLEFDGVGEYLDTKIIPTVPITISFWFKSKTYNATTRILFGQQDNPAGNRFYLGYDGSGYLGLGLGSSAYADESGGYMLDLDWHHYVVTYNGSSANVYVDGILMFTKSNSTYSPTKYLYFGALNTSTTLTSFCYGYFNLIRIYNRVLSL
jgi:hypothetical protein